MSIADERQKLLDLEFARFDCESQKRKDDIDQTLSTAAKRYAHMLGIPADGLEALNITQRDESYAAIDTVMDRAKIETTEAIDGQLALMQGRPDAEVIEYLHHLQGSVGTGPLSQAR